MVREFENSNYWAVILGGSSGLGFASALKLAQRGMNICIVHRNSRIELETIDANFDLIKAENIEFLSFNVDAIKQESRNTIISDLNEKLGKRGKIRCLLHSIAKGNLKAMIDEDDNILESDDFQITLQNMAISLYDWVKDVYKAKLFAADSRIISFTSEGSSKAWKHYAAVSASKAALEAITRSIALEYAPYGLRANCIQAGITNTASLKRIPGSDQLIEYSIKRNPFQRLTTPEDVANMVYLMCKDEAAWINGAVIPVDGGEHIS